MAEPKTRQSIWSRRQVLFGAGAAGILLAMRPLSVEAAFKAHETMPIAPGWNGGDMEGPPRYRIDGYAKVTGAKLYARDFRASDMEGWPDETRHALLVMATKADHTFEGLDLTKLSPDQQPDKVITAEDLTSASIAAEGFFKTDLFCAKGQTPSYLGQPVAILIYDDLATMELVRMMFHGDNDVVTYGDQTAVASGDPYGANRFTRVGGDDPTGPDVFSPVSAGWAGPVRYQKTHAPQWAPAKADGSADEQATFYGDQIRKELAEGTSGQVFRHTFNTQSVDQVFMEPECGLAWHDTDNNKLALVLGVQSPAAILEGIGQLLSKAKAPRAVSEIDAHFAYIGGGFGGKDHTIVPLYVAVAGMFADGRPVRLALDRFQQFQFGLKRHAFTVDSVLGVDADSGAFQALSIDLVCDGGGRANFSASVADVGATGSTSIYYLPKSDITTVANQSRGVCAGSMRGYGTLQSMTAMECLVDQVAVALDKDPIALRRTNALRTGQLNLTGNTASGAIRSREILDALEASDLWAKQADDKAAFEAANSGFAYGVGVACVMKDFGTGADAVLSSVTLAPDGTIAASSNSIEMGTGISTAVARRVADHLGRSADTVTLDAQDLWNPLGLETSGNPWGISQTDQDTASTNPRWVPAISSPASASIGAHVNTHAVAEAAAIIMRFGLWPAALAIWSQGQLGGAAAGEFIRYEDARWVDGALTGAGMEPLPLARLAERAHDMGLVTGTMVHAFNRWSWAKATFSITGNTYQAPIDALAIQTGGSDWQRLDRSAVSFPPADFERIGVNYYAGCGAVVAISVNKSSGAVRVEAVHQVLECGRAIVHDLVSGISQGGIAMGIGHALHEYLPLYEDGPGNGTWNLNRYHVPMASDVPVWTTTLDILDPLSETDPPKGMAEVVMIPVVPAILNAIHDAVGVRLTTTPVTPDMITRGRNNGNGDNDGEWSERWPPRDRRHDGHGGLSQ